MDRIKSALVRLWGNVASFFRRRERRLDEPVMVPASLLSLSTGTTHILLVVPGSASERALKAIQRYLLERGIVLIVLECHQPESVRLLTLDLTPRIDTEQNEAAR